ncbi:MAG TPA: response regulator [Acetobacteraceae bacterium]|jgi:FixJ family two-component response regulator
MNRDKAGVVAVVDDDDEVRDVLRMLLETSGHTVDTYKSGTQFLTEARFEEILCLVLDQCMPSMTGLELISALNESGVTIPTLLITGAHDTEVARKAESLGAMTVLEKPLPCEALLRFVAFSAG